MDVITFNDDVTSIDTDTELHPLVVGGALVAARHGALYLRRAAHGVNDTSELGKHAVAGCADDAATVFGDLQIEDFGAMGPEGGACSALVGLDQPRVPHHVGG